MSERSYRRKCLQERGFSLVTTLVIVILCALGILVIQDPSLARLLLYGPDPIASRNAFDEEPSDALRVLFVGNSHTFVNDVPYLVTSLAKSAGKPIWQESIARGGARLKDHLQDGKVRQILLEQSWDVVVLQAQSVEPLYDARGFQKSYRELELMVKARGVKPYLYGTWARKDGLGDQRIWKTPWAGSDFFSMQEKLTRQGKRAAGRAAFIPVGDAWAAYYRLGKEPLLHIADGNHANIAGSYLAALCIYGALFETVELPQQVYLPSGISPELAARLRTAAQSVLK